MKRHYRPQSSGLYRHNVTPVTAQWKYLSFAVLALDAGMILEETTGDQEIVIVPLVGRAEVDFEGETHRLGRADPFRDPTDIIYLPPATTYRVVADGPLEIAIGRAPAVGRCRARIMKHTEMPAFIRGDANVKRGVNVLLDSPEFTERLIVYEIRPPSGNWSSFPPHRHDTRDNSTYQEETYYYRLTPREGFAMQRLYTRDTDLDVSLTISDEDLVLIHEGYHPVVNAPGTNAYYLNFLAGEGREYRPVNDPQYEWIGKQWDGNPIPIPVPGRT
jgi:5-deoxy-glucuronate isomerase